MSTLCWSLIPIATKLKKELPPKDIWEEDLPLLMIVAKVFVVFVAQDCVARICNRLQSQGRSSSTNARFLTLVSRIVHRRIQMCLSGWTSRPCPNIPSQARKIEGVVIELFHKISYNDLHCPWSWCGNFQKWRTAPMVPLMWRVIVCGLTWMQLYQLCLYNMNQVATSTS